MAAAAFLTAQLQNSSSAHIQSPPSRNGDRRTPQRIERPTGHSAAYNHHNNNIDIGSRRNAARRNTKRKLHEPGSNDRPTRGERLTSSLSQRVEGADDICRAFNVGMCRTANPQGDHRAHVCLECRGSHPLTTCPVRSGAGNASSNGKAESKPR
jgi:hypothetical protein